MAWLLKSLFGDKQVVINLERNFETVFESIDIPDGPFTMEEYQQLKRKISNGKAAGPDSIPLEVSKLTNSDDRHHSRVIANNLLNNLEKPEQWSIIQIQHHLTISPKSGVSLTQSDTFSPLMAVLHGGL